MTARPVAVAAAEALVIGEVEVALAAAEVAVDLVAGKEWRAVAEVGTTEAATEEISQTDEAETEEDLVAVEAASAVDEEALVAVARDTLTAAAIRLRRERLATRKSRTDAALPTGELHSPAALRRHRSGRGLPFGTDRWKISHTAC